MPSDFSVVVEKGVVLFFCVIFAGVKNLVWIIVAMMVLGAVVPGCDDVVRYDGRLTAADSLIHDHADSALTMLEALAPSDLATEGDRAYHDLLLTQARYKCYRPATSDSAINRALAYYRAHPNEQEKLTRAYIYKGTVMEELGHPDSAMFYYKQAEDRADTADYSNLGYVKLQMGSLYNDYFSMGSKETVKYEEALDCYRHTDDTLHLMVCLNNLGCLYRNSKPKKAESLLLEASSLAKERNDSDFFLINAQALTVLFLHYHRIDDALQIIRKIEVVNKPSLDYKMYFTAASVYSWMGDTDSAEMCLGLARRNRTGDRACYEMYYLECLGEIALSKKDTVSFARYESERSRIEDSLELNSAKLEILQAEDNHDKLSKQDNQRKHRSRVNYFVRLIVLIIVMTLLVMFWGYRRARYNIHQYDKLIADLRQENKSQSDNLKTLQRSIDRLRIDDDKLKAFIDSHMDMMRCVIEECYHIPHGPLAMSIKKVVKYQEENAGIWNKLFHYLDVEYHSIMSSTIEHYPQLSDKDLLMIALTCVGYSCSQIAIVLGYSSASGISTIRKRIANKMRLDCSLSEYIEQFKP